MGAIEGNPVGSMLSHPYYLGLICADGYIRTSSIGITNCDVKIISKFITWMLSFFPKERIKMRIYLGENEADYELFPKVGKIVLLKSGKRRRTAYQVYVNCRSLVREFMRSKKNVHLLENDQIFEYMAGRFDGDGCFGTVRIVYSNKEEAVIDSKLLWKVGIKNSIYFYSSANTWCVYIRRCSVESFLDSIKPFSVRVEDSIPRRD